MTSGAKRLLILRSQPSHNACRGFDHGVRQIAPDTPPYRFEATSMPFVSPLMLTGLPTTLWQRLRSPRGDPRSKTSGHEKAPVHQVGLPSSTHTTGANPRERGKIRIIVCIELGSNSMMPQFAPVVQDRSGQNFGSGDAYSSRFPRRLPPCLGRSGSFRCTDRGS
jgi:hypothetical protein